MYMAEKKRIEWCRYYKGDDSFNESEAKKNWLYDYFWMAEKRYVENDIPPQLVNSYKEAGLTDFDSTLPLELLSLLFNIVLHLHSGVELDMCSEIFIGKLYPSYINKSV